MRRGDLLKWVVYWTAFVALTVNLYIGRVRAARGDCDQKCHEVKVIGKKYTNGQIRCTVHQKSTCFGCDGSTASAWCKKTSPPGKGTCKSMGMSMFQSNVMGTLSCPDDTTDTSYQEASATTDNYSSSERYWICNTGS